MTAEGETERAASAALCRGSVDLTEYALQKDIFTYREATMSLKRMFHSLMPLDTDDFSS